MKLVHDSIEIFTESLHLIAVFSVFVLAVILFLIGFSTFAVGGAGFVRYADVLAGAVSIGDALMLVFVTLTGMFALAFLTVAITLIVKLKRTMDDIGFFKLIKRFPRYIFRLMVVWSVLFVASFGVGLLFTWLRVPLFFIAFSMLLLWAFFIFAPQSIILEDKSLFRALQQSAGFVFKKPLAVLTYYAAAFFGLLALVVMEVVMGQLIGLLPASWILFFQPMLWVPVFISAVVLFVVMIPLLEILKANMFVTKHGIVMAGLK